jgi:hypothetical protein
MKIVNWIKDNIISLFKNSDDNKDNIHPQHDPENLSSWDW